MNRCIIVLLFTLCLCSAEDSFAQRSRSCGQSVNEAATICLPIRIYKNTDLQFGGLVSGSVGGNVHVFGSIGSVDLSIGGVPSAATTTNSTYPGAGGPIRFTGQGAGTLGSTARLAPQVASFIVTGDPCATYSIIVSGGTTITNTTNGSSMPLTLDPPSGGNVNGAGNQGTISSSGVVGTDRFTVGGTLSVGAGQMPGYYTGTFCVTVAYN